jgi:hypothetical protein
MTPHLDSGRTVERALAAEIARKAKIAEDAATNAANIREQLADGSAGTGGRKGIHCGICGSPFGVRGRERNACSDCIRTAKQVPPGLRDKMSPEELHPESFPDITDPE